MNTSPENKGLFATAISREQCKDTGMAAVLICLVLGYFGQFDRLIVAALVLLVVDMVAPVVFKPLAVDML